MQYCNPPRLGFSIYLPHSQKMMVTQDAVAFKKKEDKTHLPAIWFMPKRGKDCKGPRPFVKLHQKFRWGWGWCDGVLFEGIYRFINNYAKAEFIFEKRGRQMRKAVFLLTVIVFYSTIRLVTEGGIRFYVLETGARRWIVCF